MGNEQSFRESRSAWFRSQSHPRPSKSDTNPSMNSSGDADHSSSRTPATTPATPIMNRDGRKNKRIESPSLDLSIISNTASTSTPPQTTPKKVLPRQIRVASVGQNETDEDTFATTLHLSAYQSQMIAQSWPRIQQNGGHIVGAKFFKHLCQKNSQVKEIFQKATIIESFSQKTAGRCADVYKEHGRMLFDFINECVKYLNEPTSDVVEYCRKLGGKHLSLRAQGFHGAIWDDFAELLVDHITKFESIRRHREVSKAWTALIMFVVERIKDGYSAGARKSSTPSLALLKSGGTVDEEPSADKESTSDDVRV